MILDQDAHVTAATPFNLAGQVDSAGDDVVIPNWRPGPGKPIKCFATGLAADAVITVTTAADAAMAVPLACTTAVAGPDGSVEFELPSTVMQFISSDVDFDITLAGNQTNL